MKCVHRCHRRSSTAKRGSNQIDVIQATTVPGSQSSPENEGKSCKRRLRRLPIRGFQENSKLQANSNVDEYRDEYFDPKKRSKECKKNVEINKLKARDIYSNDSDSYITIKCHFRPKINFPFPFAAET